MLIERVKIIGFKSPTAILDAKLSGSNVSIIFGENGCGKTTFLKILHSILAQEENILIQNNIETVFIEYSYNNSQEIVRVSRSDFENQDNEYDWSEFLDSKLASTKSLSLGVNRGVDSTTTKIQPRYIFEFFRNPRRRAYLNNQIPVSDFVSELSKFLINIQSKHSRIEYELEFEKQHLDIQNIHVENIEQLMVEKYRLARYMATQRIQSALFDTLSMVIDIDNEPQSNNVNIPDDFEALLIENSERMIEALDDGDDNQFKITVIEILSNLNSDEDIEKIRANSILCKLFLNMMDELKIEKLILNSVNKLVDTFNKYLINHKELIVNEHEVYIKVGIDNHGLNELSSGERHILTFLSLILFEGSNRDVVIIDEPEISLNMKWQRELISLIQSLIPKTQIIVASHSPAIVNNDIHYLCSLDTDFAGNL
ncbi:AAA family ATPase [Photobacterium satsumensis]|uniref:AAA family ATPase n=1 Tax=Photobacterium satsumensis TaxID=2910239 RepID=UPI003D0C36A2